MPHQNLRFSTNNRFVGLGEYALGVETANYNAAVAWHLFKKHMADQAGWSVTRSGAAYGPDIYIDAEQDIFADSDGYRLLYAPCVWFVLQDPDEKREFLFYRSPIGFIKTGLQTGFYTGITEPVYASPKRSFTNYFSNIVNPLPYVPPNPVPAIKTVNVNSGIATIQSSGFSAANMNSSYVGHYLYVEFASYPQNSGTFKIVDVPDNTTIKVENPNAVLDSIGAATEWVICATQFMKGNNANIITSGKIARVSGLVNMTKYSIGQMLYLDALGTNNKGRFIITSVINNTTVEVINMIGSTQNVFTTENSIKWYETFQVYSLLGEDAGRMSVAYSAGSHFNQLQVITEQFSNPTGLPAGGDICKWSVPAARDMVWVSPYENECYEKKGSVYNLSKALDIYSFPAIGKGHSFAPTTFIDQQSNWAIHLCASTVAPYNFYAWWVSSFDTSGAKGTDTGWYLDKKGINPFNPDLPDQPSKSALPFDGLSFLCMDSLINTNSGDTDPVVIWCDTDHGAPCRSVSNYPRTGMSCAEGILNSSASAQCYRLCIRSWYKKPPTFSSNTDFMKQIRSYQCAFLPTQVLQYTVAEKYTAEINLYQPDRYPHETVIPGNLNETVGSNKQQVFPLMYGRGSTFYPQANQYKYVQTPDADTILYIKECFKLPPAFKGTSNFIYLAGATKREFNTLDYDGETANYIYAGRYSMIVLPWDGSTPFVV